jgi:benzoate/toluate 1,2-dioxygenase alpha subunit
MPPDDQPALEALVRPDRVHRSVYTDEALFRREMERIFCRTWIYIGHESQVRQPGDYLTTYMGLQPVVLIRDRDGQLHVLHNRCPHRGAMICTAARGNTGRTLHCGYHGWTFKTNGELLAAPLQDAYRGRYDLKSADFSLARVPRVSVYRGFVFANMTPHDEAAPDLATYLGVGKRCIDKIVDRSPAGELDVTGGVQKYEIRANWKAQVENLNDLYHPPYSHECTTDEQNRQFKRRQGDDGGVLLSANEQRPVWDQIQGVAFDYGNSYCGPLPFNHGARGGPLFEAHRAALVAHHGAERADEILTDDFHNVIFYPSVVMQLASNHVRTVRPIAVDRTEVCVYPIRLKGVPEEINRQLIRYLNITHSAASLIQTDDVEMFRRIQGGLQGDGLPWVWFNRHMAEDTIAPGVRSNPGSGELIMRNQYRAYAEFMGGDGR